MANRENMSPHIDEGYILDRIKKTENPLFGRSILEKVDISKVGISNGVKRELDPLFLDSCRGYLLTKTDTKYSELTEPTKQILEFYTTQRAGDQQYMEEIWKSLTEESHTLLTTDLSTPEQITAFVASSGDSDRLDSYITQALRHPSESRLSIDTLRTMCYKVFRQNGGGITNVNENTTIDIVDKLSEDEKKLILTYGFLSGMIPAFPLTPENIIASRETIFSTLEKAYRYETQKEFITPDTPINTTGKSGEIDYPKYAREILGTAYDEKNNKINIDNLSPGQIYALRDAGFYLGSIFLTKEDGTHPIGPEDLKNGTFVVNLGPRDARLARAIGAADLLFPKGFDSTQAVTGLTINGVKGILRAEPRAGYYTVDGEKFGDGDDYMEIWSGYQISDIQIGALTGTTVDPNTLTESLDRQAYETRKSEYLEKVTDAIDGATETVNLTPLSSTDLDRAIFKDVIETSIFPRIGRTGQILKADEAQVTILQEQVKGLQENFTHLTGGVEGSDGGGFRGATDAEYDKHMNRPPNIKVGFGCSWCTRQTFARCFGMYDGDTRKPGNGLAYPADTALNTMKNYKEGISNPNPTKDNTLIKFEKMSGSYQNLFQNIPAGTDIMDVFTGSKAHAYEGHRVSMHKWGGHWFVIDAYWGGNAKPVPAAIYFTKNNSYAGTDIRGVAYHNSPAISDTQANEGTQVSNQPERNINTGTKGSRGIAVDFFRSKNIPEHQIKGLIANLESENADWSYTTLGDGGKAYGLMQWHPDRQERFLKEFGHTIQKSTFEEQLRFILIEMEKYEPGAWAELQKATTAQAAGYAVSRFYTRGKGASGDPAIESNRRAAIAEKIKLPTESEAQTQKTVRENTKEEDRLDPNNLSTKAQELREKDRGNNKTLAIIDETTQMMILFDAGNKEITRYPISTAAAGIGNEKGSDMTPPGMHKIKMKIGNSTTDHKVFEARQNTQKDLDPKSNVDQVTSRIMWLEGADGAKNANSYDRYIYIHGTNKEGSIGSRASHGCIRMKNAAVIQAFEQLEENSIVYVGHSAEKWEG